MALYIDPCCCNSGNGCENCHNNDRWIQQQNALILALELLLMMRLKTAAGNALGFRGNLVAGCRRTGGEA
jgi:hypothetical protein